MNQQFQQIKCSKCDEEKNPSEFYKNKNRKNGLQPYCKSCQSMMAAERYRLKKNKDLDLNKNQMSFEKMQQKDIAELFEVKRITIRDWNDNQGCPRNEDGSYNLKNVIRWWKNYKKTIGKKICPFCMKVKTYRHFYSSFNKGKTRLSTHCKECFRKYQREHQRDLPDPQIKQIIKIKYGVSKKDISQKMIEQEREFIKLGRLIRRKKNVGK